MESFFDIEEKKKKVIYSLFLFLLFLYFFTFYSIFFLFISIFQNIRILSYSETFFIFLISSLIAYFHWSISTRDIADKILNILQATPLDEEDAYHRILKTVVEEISISAGGINLEVFAIPVSSLNAFSISDLKKRNIVGVTEGLLFHLNRMQLQAVIAHEIAHIINGDSFLTTVSTSFFDIYNFILEKMADFTSRSRRVPVQFFLILIFLYFIQILSKIVNLFISRQREYRADATATRLTRNPQSLAEALYIISRHSNSIGIAADNLENIFIINPKNRKIDEREGIIAALFSTHPPVRKRIELLLKISHNDFLNMVEKIEREENMPKEVPIFHSSADKKYFVCTSEGKWVGPFSRQELPRLDFITPSTFIYNKELKKGIYKVSEEKELFSFLFGKIERICPLCKGNLVDSYYEGTKILTCMHCGGYFVEEEKLKRILSRKIEKFSEEVIKKAEFLKKNRDKFFYRTQNIDTPFILNCPKCSQKLRRMFYNYAYPVEIDKCFSCNGIWFEKDELEILQYLILNAEVKTHIGKFRD